MSHPLGQRLRHVFSGNNLPAGQGGARTTRFKPPELRDLRSTANNEIHDVDILFVHDIAQDPEQQWLVKGENHKLWSSDILQIAVPRARILLYQYDAGDLGNIADILSSEDLVQQAEILIGMLNRTTLPIIFVGYGYGGLVCEQVAVLFHNKYREMRHRITGFLFFGTPQASPGLAEWAILVAKRRGIKCAKAAQLQDWSSLKEEFESFEEMQADFQELFDSSRDSEQAKRVACCFAKIRTPINEIVRYLHHRMSGVVTNAGLDSITRMGHTASFDNNRDRFRLLRNDEVGAVGRNRDFRDCWLAVEMDAINSKS
ncbi:S-adenosylmethionine-dependent methyltransferase [Hypoxylon texense]